MWIGIMNKLIYGSIYRQQVIFRGNEGFKVRPVFVLFTDNDDVYFFSISTKPGKDHQKKYRAPILNWRKAGLDKPSYIMLDDPPYILSKSMFTDDKYLGQTIGMDLDMFELHMSSLGY